MIPGQSGAPHLETVRNTQDPQPRIQAAGFAEQPRSQHSATVQQAEPVDMAQQAHPISQALRRTRDDQGQGRS